MNPIQYGGKKEQNQHVAHGAFKIHNFWPHDPNTWFRQLESKFRICNISVSSTKYDHLLTALPREVCSNINDSLEDINENAADTYEQLKALLVSRYMKPTELMWQMKALLPTANRPGTYFMASFLLRLPSDMRDHLIAKDFKDCTKMAKYADLLYSSRAGNTIAAINAVSGGCRREFLPHDRRQERRSLSRQTGHLLLPHNILRQGKEMQARVPVDRRKRNNRRELNTLGGGMIFLQDDKSKQQIMVNTSAVCSVLPQ